MIIDCHHHLSKESDYAEKLLDECQKLKIDKVCLIGLPEAEGFSTNSQICTRFYGVAANIDVIEAAKEIAMLGFKFLDIWGLIARKE